MDKAQLAPDSSPPLAKRELPSQAHGSGLRFKTLDHGGEYPDTMPQAIGDGSLEANMPLRPGHAGRESRGRSCGRN
jgi:hypothetical protein